jgi:hypothetical protein
MTLVTVAINHRQRYHGKDIETAQRDGEDSIPMSKGSSSRGGVHNNTAV